MQQKIVLWFTALAVALGSMAGLAVRTALAETSELPIVISAVQITGGEGKSAEDFIELYNPNPFPVDLNGYRIVKRAATSTADSSIKSFSTETLVPAYSFYLWANSEFLSIVTAPDATTSATLANDNGIGLRFGPLDTGELIDSVTWGVTTNGFANSGLTNPEAGQSLQRIDLFESLGYEIALSNPRNSSVQVVPDVVPAEQNNSSCLVVQNDLTVSANQVTAVNITFSNIGNTVWQSDSYLVKQLSPTGATDLPLGVSDINPLSDLDLALQITAPLTAGEYSYQWQMAANGVLFGDACLLRLTVIVSEPDPESTLTTVRITEFLPNPIGDDGGQEVVELYNHGSQAINLKDWIMDDSDSWPASSNAYALPEQSLGAGKYLAITIPAGKFGLNNTGGDILTLFNSAGAEISKVSYSGTAAEGKTYSLVDGKWYWTAPSLGAANPSLPDEDPEDPPADDSPEEEPDPESEGTPMGVIISELYPAPKPSDSEFIELYNGASADVNLKIFKLAIGNRVVSLPDLLLPSGGYYALSGAELKLQLADAGKTVQLLASDGVVLNEVSYPKAKRGQSYSWFEDSYLWTLSVTSGEENQFEAEAVELGKEKAETKINSLGQTSVKASKSSALSSPKKVQSSFDQPQIGQSNTPTPESSKKANPLSALAVALASLGAGVFAAYKFGLVGV